MSSLRPTFAVYLRLVSAAGAAVLLAMLVGAAGSFGPLDLEFWLLAGLVLLGELYPIQVHGQTGEETFSTPFGFAMLLIYGAPQVALVQAVSSLIADLIRRRPADRIVFNLAQLTISWAAAGAVLDLLGGTGLSSGDSLQADELPAITASAVAFFLVNSTLVRTAEALQMGIAVARPPDRRSALSELVGRDAVRLGAARGRDRGELAVSGAGAGAADGRDPCCFPAGVRDGAPRAV